MDNFGFTRKKFNGLKADTQHRHLIKWLSRCYQSLRGNRVESAQFTAMVDQYNTALAWMELPPRPEPDSGGKAWFAFVSDAIHFHRTCLGQCPKDDGLLPLVSTADRTDSSPLSPRREIIVALDGLRSLFNVGSIFRTCDAAGVSGLILGNTPGGDHPRVAKTAMGTQEWMPQESVEDLYQALMDKKARGFTILGVETADGALPCQKVEWPDKLILVLGNEEYGLSPQTMAACDGFVTIPMFGRKNSLNVANAAAVVLFQAALAH